MAYMDLGNLWRGITGAAVCTYGIKDLDGSLRYLQQNALVASGFGLVVEVDLNRLPRKSIDSSFFSVSREEGKIPA